MSVIADRRTESSEFMTSQVDALRYAMFICDAVKQGKRFVSRIDVVLEPAALEMAIRTLSSCCFVAFFLPLHE